jgi:hypothetical protein
MKRKITAFLPYGSLNKQAFVGPAISLGLNAAGNLALPIILPQKIQRWSANFIRALEARANRKLPTLRRASLWYNHGRGWIPSSLRHMVPTAAASAVINPAINLVDSSMSHGAAQNIPSSTEDFAKYSMLKYSNLSPLHKQAFMPQGVVNAYNNVGNFAKNTYNNASNFVKNIPADKANKFSNRLFYGTAGVGAINTLAEGGSLTDAAMQFAPNAVGHVGNKVLQKFAPTAARRLGKYVPFAGSAISAYDSIKRFGKGDILGGFLSAGQGVANLFPGVGTAVGAGLEAIDAFRPAPRLTNATIAPTKAVYQGGAGL